MSKSIMLACVFGLTVVALLDAVLTDRKAHHTWEDDPEDDDTP